MLKFKYLSKTLITTLAILSLCLSVYAKTSYVPQDYPAIQPAIDASGPGDMVMVSTGAYVGNITIKNGVILQGAGYNTTTIDGAGTGNVVTMEDGAEIRGFSIVNGGTGDFSGIRCLGRVIIRDNDIRVASYNGIYGEKIGDTRIMNNIIHGYARRGISASLSSPIIEGNIIHSINIFSTWYGIVTITDSTTPCSPVIRNNTIMYNQGPAINVYNTTAIVGNNILMYNQSAIYRPANYSSKVVINTYNNAYGNGDTDYVNIIPGEGSISVDPLFVDLYSQDFSLQAGSPCINAGNPASEYKDKDGSRNDMGAYGGPNGMQSEADITPPVTTGHNPSKDEVNVSKSTNIKVYINDSCAGVDLSTVRISVEELTVYDGSNPAAYPDTTISGDRWEYVFNYNPPVCFSYNQIVNVCIEAADLKGNVMPRETYSFIIASQPEKSANWQKEIVDPSLMMCLGSSIAVDSKGKAHISYFDFMTSSVNYVTNIDGDWDITNLDINISPENGSAIAVDAQDRVHMVYSCMDEMGGQYVKYALKGNPEAPWNIEIIAGPTSMAGLPSITVDKNGNAYIAYIDRFSEVLKYASKDSAIWQTQDVDTVPSYCYYSSIGIDTNKYAHIIYLVDNDMKYATNSAGEWDCNVVKEGIFNAALAIDSKNSLHISYDDNAKQEVGYLTNASGEWVPKVIDNYTSNWLYTKIAVDSQNKVHIAYSKSDIDQSMLKYASNVCGYWNTEEIEEGADSAAIAVDSSDNVHISYFLNSTMEPMGLKYAYGIYNLKGDINQDNKLNVLDVQLCVNVILAIETDPNRVKKAKETAEPKDKCNVLDVQAIVNIILGQV